MSIRKAPPKGPTADDFIPLLRQDKVPLWRLAPDATNYSIIAPLINHTQDAATVKANLAKWKGLGHPVGIQILHKWDTQPKGQAAIAGYNGLNDQSLLNFVDTVGKYLHIPRALVKHLLTSLNLYNNIGTVCDIVPKGLLFMASRLKNAVAKELISDEELEVKIPHHMEATFSASRSSVNDLSDESRAQRLIGPDLLINQYMEDNKIKSLTDKIIHGLTFPMFLPVTASMVGRGKGEEIDVAATVLAHAVQILLFAPTRWNKDIEYRRPNPDYTLRYPTPDGHGGNCRSVGGLLSLEDLHRAIILLYTALYRRTAPGASNIRSNRLPAPPDSFLGYFDVKRQTPVLGDEAEMGPAQRAVIRSLANRLTQMDTWVEDEKDSPITTSQLLTRSVEPSNGLSQTNEQTQTQASVPSTLVDKSIEMQTLYMECGNLEEAHAKIATQVTTFTSLMNQQQMAEFSDTGFASEAVQQVLADKSDEEEALNHAIRRSYALEMIFNGQPPPEGPDIQSICRRFDIEEWPSLKLYPATETEPLKPHQVADLGVIFDKLDHLGHVLLSNEMGLGKTKVFAATIECYARELERIYSAGSGKPDGIFFPTLIVNPVSTIHQTHRELKTNFPGLTVLLYYTTKSMSKRFNGAHIIDKSEFEARMRNLSPTDPNSARTMVVTTYSTLYNREVMRSEKRFIFLERRQGGRQSKRQRGVNGATLDGDEADTAQPDSNLDSDWMDMSEMMRAKMKLPMDEKKKIPRYTSEIDPDLRGKRLHFLSDDDSVQPDGSLAQHELKRLFVAKIRWAMLIVDDAHMARRLDGAFNNTFRLLNWDHLVWVTGTPLMSTLRDILSPLWLIWHKININIPVLWVKTIGHVEGLWNDEYDPYEEETVFADGSKTRGILSESFIKEHPSLEWAKLKEFHHKTGIKLWQINPFLVDAAGRAAEWSSDFGQKVVSVVLQILSLRRTLRSRLVLPDGSVSYPGADLLPMVISTEELSFDRTHEDAVKKHGHDTANNSFSVSQHGPTLSRREGSIYFRAYREGVLVSYDWRNLKILYSNVEAIFGKDVHGASELLTAFRDKKTLTDKDQQRLLRRASKGDTPTVGVCHLQKLLSFDNNAGLDYFFSRTCLDRAVLAPPERLGWLVW
ncbi:hypothetical protein THARTR1_07148 [Trichoderma harzianum]|uniref:Helicase ATP-binding domain-containing protein n=1 Tax=Trichoderma harzianum TaxID=5544 RepID=A0A2K0U2D3_TRIHA|nr:hypothetical protein THARTR1_07148 [Trichoderma harzianum]